MRTVKLFVCGDVMTGRGIDQILAHPCDPALHEGYASSALDYVQLAESASGPIPRGVPGAYLWGDALEELARAAPQARIVNLETAVTTSEDWVAKGINYRMHPANAECLAAARIDCCTLANNHVLDWGEAGLAQTLDTLHAAGLRTAGAGRARGEAEAPAELPLPGGGRVLVFAAGAASSGVPAAWAASERAPGVDFLPDLSEPSAARLAERMRAACRPRDLVVLSIHWGANWGYGIASAETELARRLIDAGAADLVCGHSSHHPKGIEVHRGKLILYGCGDLINDYEGIGGYESYRGDLGLMYFPALEADSGKLAGLELAAVRRRRFRLERAGEADCEWLCGLLNSRSSGLEGRFRPLAGGGIALA
jgi:poly-gamma-glutamate synthesis protein (capsule biosynthesis protein)